MRVSAKKLLQHRWIKGQHRAQGGVASDKTENKSPRTNVADGKHTTGVQAVGELILNYNQNLSQSRTQRRVIGNGKLQKDSSNTSSKPPDGKKGKEKKTKKPKKPKTPRSPRKKETSSKEKKEGKGIKKSTKLLKKEKKKSQSDKSKHKIKSSKKSIIRRKPSKNPPSTRASSSSVLRSF